jgi:hypothetical protein
MNLMHFFTKVVPDSLRKGRILKSHNKNGYTHNVVFHRQLILNSVKKALPKIPYHVKLQVPQTCGLSDIENRLLFL